MKKIMTITWGVLVLFIILQVNVTKVYADDDNTKKASTKNQFMKCLYDEMLLRKSEVVIDYKGKDYKEIFDSFEREEYLKQVSALDDPNTSDDFDYLGHNISYMRTQMNYNEKQGAIFTITINWRENYEQLQYVNARINQILTSLNITDNTANYEKTKKIHDYIVENVEYDSNLKKDNAYYALKEGSATCQGYSLLYYKMLTEAKVKCRYVTGIGTNESDSGPHAWNIVKLGKKWYNIDITWDDPVYVDEEGKASKYKKKIGYDFFLKGSNEFDKGHKKDEEFKTADFIQNYPISDTNFNIDQYEEEYDEEAPKPLKWDLADDPDNLIQPDGFLASIGQWIMDVASGKENFFTSLKDKWNNADIKYKLVFIIAILLLIILKLKNRLFSNKFGNGRFY